MVSNNIYVRAEEIEAFGRKLFMKLGLPRADAAVVSKSLVHTSMLGIESHGIMRFSLYVNRLLSSGINPKPIIKTTTETSGITVFDADNAMGQVAASMATDQCIKNAKETGIGYTLVNNANHFGAAGYWASTISENDMIGLAISNGPSEMGMEGVKSGLIGNNPIAISVPTKKDFPVTLDIALSVVAGGRIRMAAKNGTKIPEGWALDKDGNMTTDPHRALSGILLPIGLHKGFGLAVMIDCLTGVLSGGGYSKTVTDPWNDLNKAGNTSFAFMALNIDSFIEMDKFHYLLDEMIGDIQKAPRKEGTNIFVPGEIEHESFKERAKNGIPISSKVLEELEHLSKGLNVPFNYNNPI